MREQRSRTALLGCLIAIIGAALLLSGMLGARTGIVPQLTGFGVANFGVLLSAVALILSVIGLVRTRSSRLLGRGRAIAGFLISALVIAPVASQLPVALSVPPIHDITTDTDAPPHFKAVVPLRQDAPNSLEYGGAEIAAQQRQAYPDIRPLLLDVPPRDAFARVQKVAAAMDWEIVAADPVDGRLEATVRTRWFGFKDDIVIVARATDAGATQIDIRSVSRVGKSDLGANARRIRAFMAALSEG